MRQDWNGTAPFVADSAILPLCWLLARDWLRLWWEACGSYKKPGALPEVGRLHWVPNIRTSHSQGSETALAVDLTTSLCENAIL